MGSVTTETQSHIGHGPRSVVRRKAHRLHMVASVLKCGAHRLALKLKHVAI